MNEEPKKRSWRRWRISLRTLLILVALISAFLGLYLVKAIQQQRLVQSLVRDGAIVEYYRDHGPADSGTNYSKLRAPEWLVSIFGIDFFDRVHSVYLGDSEFNELSKLAVFSDMKILHLEVHNTDDLAPCIKLKKLSHLGITKFSGNLEPIGEMENLRKLILFGGDSPLPASANVWNDKSSSFEDERVTYDLSQLSRSTSLREVTLLHCIEKTDLNPLSEIENLETLFLYSPAISDINGLSQCENLKKLTLLNSPTTDLSPLYGLKQLEELRLRGRISVDKEQVEEFKQQNPNCKVDVIPNSLKNSNGRRQ